MWPLGDLQTTDGRRVEVIDPGLHNRNAGPDFFNAKVKIADTLWVGNVEIHDRSSHWYQHGHDKDEHYNNVVLHVVGEADRDVQTMEGNFVPQLVMQVPPSVLQNYEELLKTDQYPPCYKIIPTLTPLVIHSWMAALQTERLEQKTIAIRQRAEERNGSWEDAYFQTLARNYGFGINGDAFEEWARHIPLGAVGKHRDNLFQIEAIFMGQAGLLELNTVPERYQQQALNEGYFAKLRNEYQYLAHKFQLQPMNAQSWRFLRLRPQNFPQLRVVQLAQLYYRQTASLSALFEAKSREALHEAFDTQATEHFSTQKLSAASRDLLIINTVVPFLFAYGMAHNSEEHQERAVNLLEQLKPEQNFIIRQWQQCGLSVTTAADSQALIQLKRKYCDRHDCLRCRFSFEYLRKKA